MEQLGEIILSFEAFAEANGEVKQFTLCVRRPKHVEDRGYFCRVECPYLREKHFKIFGIDEIQACELSISFVRQCIRDKGACIVDNSGKQIAIPEIVFEPPQN